MLMPILEEDAFQGKLGEKIQSVASRSQSRGTSGNKTGFKGFGGPQSARQVS